MKRLLLYISMFLAAVQVHAQNNFFDDFDQYTAGAFIAASSTKWATWSGVRGGADDTRISNSAPTVEPTA